MMERSNPKGLLHGLRVLDLTRVISGPYATMMLADMGADVVKVEEPKHGDEMRNIVYRGRAPHDQDYFNANNRSKRSITLNLKDSADRDIAQQLARKADVVIENFAPGVADRLEVGWQRLSEINGRLVYCSISGFGQSGPYRSRPALDPIIQALSGVMSVTGYEGHEPMQVGAPVGDVVAGMFAAFAIVCAWSDVSRSGKGRYIDISMLDSLIAVLGPRMGETLQAGRNPARHGNQNPMRVPTNTYLTRDGKYLMVAVLNDGHWRPFCAALGEPNWCEDPRYRTMALRVAHRAELDKMASERFKMRDADEWQARLAENRVPFGMVNTYLDAVNDPQVAHRELIKELVHPTSGRIQVVGAPWRIENLDINARPAPLLGQHTAEVLMDWLSWQSDEANARQPAPQLRADA